ncbi:hypothetical protein MN608_03261 [Microdochium nivale]|nr:hypothetical protein MN608_03261 [Microdochium nivale]
MTMPFARQPVYNAQSSLDHLFLSQPRATTTSTTTVIGDAAHLQRVLLVFHVVALPAGAARERGLPAVGRAHGAGRRLFELRGRRAAAGLGQVWRGEVDLCGGLGAGG